MQALALKQEQCYSFKLVSLSDALKLVEGSKVRTEQELADPALEASIRKFGVLTPIVVREGKVIEGWRVLRTLERLYKTPAERAGVKVPVVEITCGDLDAGAVRTLIKLHEKPAKTPQTCYSEALQAYMTGKPIDVEELCPICEAVFEMVARGITTDAVMVAYDRCLQLYTFVVRTQDFEVGSKLIAKAAARGWKEVEEKLRKEWKSKAEKKEEPEQKKRQVELVEVKPKPKEEELPIAVEEEEEKIEPLVEEELKEKAADPRYYALYEWYKKHKEEVESAVERKSKIFQSLLEVGMPHVLAAITVTFMPKELVEELRELYRSGIKEERVVSLLYNMLDGVVEVPIPFKTYSALRDLASLLNASTVELLVALINKAYEKTIQTGAKNFEEFLTKL